MSTHLEGPREEKVNCTPTLATVLRYPNVSTHLEGPREEKVNCTPHVSYCIKVPQREHASGGGGWGSKGKLNPIVSYCIKVFQT